MTAIVGIVEDGNVYIGADSIGSCEGVVYPRADTKVFTKGPFAFGFAGSFRAGQIMKYVVEVPVPTQSDGDLHAFMVRRFVPIMQKGLKSAGFSTDDGSCHLLVGINGRLFEVDVDYQIAESPEGFMSIGAGAEAARASLLTSTKLCGFIPARHRLEAALEVASRYCANVGAPFHFVSVQGNMLAPNPPC